VKDEMASGAAPPKEKRKSKGQIAGRVRRPPSTEVPAYIQGNTKLGGKREPRSGEVVRHPGQKADGFCKAMEKLIPGGETKSALLP